MFELEISKVYLLATIRMFVVGVVKSVTIAEAHVKPVVYVRDLGQFDTFFNTLRIQRYQKMPEWYVACQSLQGRSGVLDPKVMELNSAEGT